MKFLRLRAFRLITLVYILASCQPVWAVTCAQLFGGKFPLNLKLQSEPNAPVDSAGIVLYHLDETSGEVQVLIRKVANNFGGYKWSFAKGRIDAGENMRVTAKREVVEEFGVDSAIQGWLMDAVGDTTTTRFYVGTIKGEINFGFSSFETERIALVSIQEARGLLNRQRDQIVLRNLEQTIKEPSRGHN